MLHANLKSFINRTDLIVDYLAIIEPTRLNKIINTGIWYT